MEIKKGKIIRIVAFVIAIILLVSAAILFYEHFSDHAHRRNIDANSAETNATIVDHEVRSSASAEGGSSNYHYYYVSFVTMDGRRVQRERLEGRFTTIEERQGGIRVGDQVRITYSRINPRQFYPTGQKLGIGSLLMGIFLTAFGFFWLLMGNRIILTLTSDLQHQR